MKSKIEVEKMLAEAKADERLAYKPADVFTNAPLALIQVSLEAQVHTLERVLGLPLSKFPLKKKSNAKA